MNHQEASWKESFQDASWRFIMMIHDDDISSRYIIMIYHHDTSSWHIMMIYHDDISWWLSWWYIMMIYHDDISSSWIILMNHQEASWKDSFQSCGPHFAMGAISGCHASIHGAHGISPSISPNQKNGSEKSETCVKHDRLPLCLGCLPRNIAWYISGLFRTI